MIKSDILIIGAGPVGLFAVFEAGLLKMKCHLIDILPKPGGQCIELYPKKPIYDIPAYPEILAGDLIENLLKQNRQFKPGFTLGEKAEKLLKKHKPKFIQIEFNWHQLIKKQTLYNLSQLINFSDVFRILPHGEKLIDIDPSRPENNIYHLSNYVFIRKDISNNYK